MTDEGPADRHRDGPLRPAASSVARVSPSILLVTCAALPDGEPEGSRVVEAFAARGWSARWVVWDDRAVDWAAADVVAVRSTWDYDDRLEEFLAWARRVDGLGTLLNGADAFAWSLDKGYLVELGEWGLPIVPTVVVEHESELAPAVAAYAPAVVKPTVAAGGRGLVVFDTEPDGPAALDESELTEGPWVVQPLVASVRTDGEQSVFVLGGRAVAQVGKRPAGEEVRVHEEYGGRSEPVPLDPDCAATAATVVAEVASRRGWALPYARVDLLRHEGRWVVSEVELVEPGLYLDVVPALAADFADAVLAARP